MADVRLRAAADADFAAILDYSIDNFGEVVGVDYVRSFDRAFGLLRRHPEAGALRLEIDPRFVAFRTGATRSSTI